MKPKKPCANCGVVPRINQAGGWYWIDCKNKECSNPMHQRDYQQTPEAAIAVWDVPRWYEVPPIDDVPPLDNQRREVYPNSLKAMYLKMKPDEWRNLYYGTFDNTPDESLEI